MDWSIKVFALQMVKHSSHKSVLVFFVSVININCIRFGSVVPEKLSASNPGGLAHCSRDRLGSVTSSHLIQHNLFQIK